MKKLGVGILAVLLLSAPVHAATISVENWSGDPSSNGQVDWSAGSAAFTHARNFAHTSDVDVTFVSGDGYGLTSPFTFYGTATPTSFSGDGGSGTLTATNGSTTLGDFTIDDAGATKAITMGCRVDDYSTLTLTGLTANTDYELVLYQANVQANRVFTLTFNNIGAGDPTTKSGVNRGNTKVSIAYTTGTNTSVSLDIDSEEGDNHSWNWYAFSNETIVLVPEPSTSVLAALGLLSLGLVGWRRRRRA